MCWESELNKHLETKRRVYNAESKHIVTTINRTWETDIYGTSKTEAYHSHRLTVHKISKLIYIAIGWN